MNIEKQIARLEAQKKICEEQNYKEDFLRTFFLIELKELKDRLKLKETKK